MIWAALGDQRVRAWPNGRARCPCCAAEVHAKCGHIVVWHWAHMVDDCDPWYEPESQWHLGWKQRFPDDWQEIAVGAHRADVKTPKLVVELQAGTLSKPEIMERESHYRNMVWLIRGEGFADNLRIRNRGDHVTFRWKWPRKSWWAATSPMVFDLGDSLLHVRKIYPEVPCGGWGNWISIPRFLQRCGLIEKSVVIQKEA